MTDFATLTLATDTRGIVTADKQLDQLAKTGEKTENRWSQSSKKMTAANANNARSAKATTKAYDMMRVQIVAGSAAIGAAVLAAFSVQPLFEFTTALAEVSTLVDTTVFDMAGLTAAATAQSAAYGSGAAAQAKAFYSIISAGASSAAQANDILTASNKLAVGGVTSVEIASDGLTSVLNAYGASVGSATDVSDTLFVGMRAGKTTIAELSGSLGKVAPLAAQTGVGFDELVASVAALTKGGIATNEAVTGVRAILAAVAKPTSEAAKLAKALGIEFNSAALEAKGFQGFLDELVQKTGGSTDALAQLFGGVEALVPAMALSGQAGVDFSAIMQDMAEKAGQTQVAFDKMAASPAFQAGRVWSSLSAEILGVSGSMSGPLAAGLKLVADNMGLITASVVVFTAGHLAAAIIPVIAQVATLTAGMSAAAVAARGLSLAMAFLGGPIGAAVIALAGGVYLLSGRHREAATAASASAEAHAKLAEQVTNVNYANESAVNSTMAAAQANVKAAQAALANAQAQRALIQAQNQDPRAKRSRTQSVDRDIDGYRNEIEGLNRLMQSMAISSIAYVAPEIETASSATIDLASAMEGAGIKAAKAAQSAKDAFKNAVASIKADTSQLLFDANSIGIPQEISTLLAKEQELINAALQDGRPITAALTQEVSALAGAYASAEQNMTLAEQAQKAFEDSVNFARDVTGGFISDLKSGLKSGEGFWDSFKNAASNALDKIADKLLNSVLDAIFQVNNASSGLGGGGGLFGTLLGGLGSLFGGGGGLVPVTGLYANGTNSAVGGMSLVGERGPELVNLPRGSQVFTNPQTQRMLAGNNNQPQAANQPVNLSVTNTFDGETIRTTIRDEAGAIVAQNNAAMQKQMPKMVYAAQQSNKQRGRR